MTISVRRRAARSAPARGRVRKTSSKGAGGDVLGARARGGEDRSEQFSRHVSKGRPGRAQDGRIRVATKSATLGPALRLAFSVQYCSLGGTVPGGKLSKLFKDAPLFY